MALAAEFRGDILVTGTTIMTGGAVLPDSSIVNRNVQPGADIDYDKLEHLHCHAYRVATGVTVASIAQIIHLARYSGQVVAIEVVPEQVPVGGTMQYTIDLQKSLLPAAFATILSSVITVNTASVNLTQQNGIITSPALVDGSALKLVVTASGAGGTQGTGLLVLVWVAESTT